MEKYIFDIFLGAIAIIVIVLSAKKGFAISLLNTISIVASSILSYKISKPLSEFIYSSFLSDKIELKLAEVLTGLSRDISLNEKINSLVEALPRGLVNASGAFGFDLETAVTSFNPVDLSDGAIAGAFTDNVASEIFIPILSVIILVVTFVALSFGFNIISKSFNKVVRKIPVVGTTNTFLGGVLGIFKALVFVVVICLVVSAIVFSIDMPRLENIISHSLVYRFITENIF